MYAKAHLVNSRLLLRPQPRVLTLPLLDLQQRFLLLQRLPMLLLVHVPDALELSSKVFRKFLTLPLLLRPLRLHHFYCPPLAQRLLLRLLHLLQHMLQLLLHQRPHSLLLSVCCLQLTDLIQCVLLFLSTHLLLKTDLLIWCDWGGR
jgi:hypothetical protein